MTFPTEFTIREVVWIALILCVVTLLIAYKVNQHDRWVAVVVLTWVVHALARSTVRELWPTALTAIQLNAWSNAITLHAILIFISGGILSIFADRIKAHV